MTQTQHRVTVIGAGILGAAAAVELVSRGHRVAVLDDPAGSPVASDAAFGWLTRAGSAAAGPGREIPELATALRDTRALLARLDRAPAVAWCGAASWAETPEQTRAFVAGSGGDAELLDPAGRARALPGLRLAPEAIAWAPNEAALDAWATRRALLGHAVRSGAVLRNDRVTGIEALPGGGFRATTASGEQLDSERIVLACGVGIPALAEQLGARVALAPSPAARFSFAAPELRLAAVVSTPEFEIRPDGPGRFVAAEDVTPGEPESETRARRSLEAVRAAFGLPSVPEPEQLTVGWRPIPAGRAILCEPLSGHAGALALAAHPGVTLAATLARSVARWAALGSAEAG